jgi:hypothetical protein
VTILRMFDHFSYGLVVGAVGVMLAMSRRVGRIK